MMRDIRTLVVDDEPAARARVIRLLEADSDVRLVAECRNAMEALKVLGKEPIDLIFLDVQMPQLSGFDLIQKLGPDQVPFIVFVTAHDHYALKAFNVNAVDYLLKPYDDERFYSSLERAKDYVSMRESKELTSRMMDLVQDHMSTRRHYLNELVIREKGREYRVPTREVFWIESEGNYLVIQTDKRRYMLRMTMNMLESELNPAEFVRIHRSYIVNMAHVQSTRYSGNNEFTFKLRGGKLLNSGRSFREQVAKALVAREEEE